MKDFNSFMELGAALAILVAVVAFFEARDFYLGLDYLFSFIPKDCIFMQ